MDGAISLLPLVEVEKLVEVERVDATERRDRKEELDDPVYDEAIELRFESMTCWNIRKTTCGGCLLSRASTCRIESSGKSAMSSMVER